jgi:hypothetical protein
MSKKMQVSFAFYLFGLFFTPENRGSMFLWNSGKLPGYMALYCIIVTAVRNLIPTSGN